MKRITLITDAPLIGLLVLWFIAFCLSLYGLGGVPLRDFDEATVARVAYELSQSNGADQLLPTIWSNPYLNKPPGLHWAIAKLINLNNFFSSNQLPSEFLIRLAPASLSTLVIPLGGLIQWKLRPKEPITTLATSTILLTLLPIIRHGRLAMLDGTQLTAIALFWLLLVSIDNSPRDNIRFLMSGLIASFMLLLKAPLLIPIICAAVLPMLMERVLWEWSWGKWFCIGLVPGSLWHIWHAINRGNEALNLWLGDGASRVIFDSGQGSDLGFLVPLIELIEGGWPWLVLLPFATYLAWHERKSKWGKWVIGTSLILIISILPLKTQLPWYSHPLWLPFALLCGPAVSELIKKSKSIFHRNLLLRLIPYSFLLLGSLVLSFSLLSFAGLIKGFESYLLISIPVGSGWLVGGYLLNHKKMKIRQLAISSLALGNLVGLFILMGSPNWIWELNETWNAKPVGEMIRKANPGEVVMEGSNERPSLNWYAEQRIVNKSSRQSDQWLLTSNQRKSKYLIEKRKNAKRKVQKVNGC